MSALIAEVHVEDGVVRLEPRVARIESDVANLKETVKKLDAKLERLDEKFDEKFERLDGKINHLGARMACMETEFGYLKESQARFGVDLRDLCSVDLRDLRSSLDTKFLWILTTMIAFGMALLAALAEGFHWVK
ncbi:MAG: hypothetical protein KGO22_17255 [Gammaproteobacteria bacterium]|nr:hypothetical protein [Gammaproteobacteria bacterium]